MIPKYRLEFILNTHNTSLDYIKNSLIELGEGLELSCLPGEENKPYDLEVRLVTLEPTVIFDVCSQFGRIKSVKVEEIKSI